MEVRQPMATIINKAALELATPLRPVRVIGPKGPVPFSVARCDSDEYGQLNTVTQDGVTLGISAYNPSENCWQYPKVATGEMSNGTSLSVLEILGSVVFHGVRRINGLVLP